MLGTVSENLAEENLEVASKSDYNPKQEYKTKETGAGDYISILTYDENIKPSDNFLTSPRSIQACCHLGVLQSELIRKDLEQFKKEPVPQEFKDDPQLYHTIRYENFEYNR